MSTERKPSHPVDPQFSGRWSPRAMSGAAITEAELMTLFEAARWAPSASNIQPWRFLYGRAGTPAFALILESLVPFNQAWAQRASALVMAISLTQSTPPGKTEPQAVPTHAFDAGAAWMSLALQAHASGWISHAMAGFDHAVARRNLAIPDDHALHAVIAIGKRGDKAMLPEALQAREFPSDRLPLSATVAEGRFSFA